MFIDTLKGDDDDDNKNVYSLINHTIVAEAETFIYLSFLFFVRLKFLMVW